METLPISEYDFSFQYFLLPLSKVLHFFIVVNIASFICIAYFIAIVNELFFKSCFFKSKFILFFY